MTFARPEIAVGMLGARPPDAAMITPDQHKRLKELDEFVMNYQRAGKTYSQFWDDFDEAGKVVDAQARADDADEDLVEVYFEIVDEAHEAFGGPPEKMDQVMEG